MNLPSWIQGLLAARRAGRVCAGKRIFGQNARVHLEYGSIKPFMLLSFARRAAICLCWGIFLTASANIWGQTNYYSANGTEYAVIGSLPGDQVFPDVALNTNGGFVVCQGNATDGSGWGVSARRLDGTLSGTLSTFRVNAQGTNDQENARVALLKNGGAVFVWQGGRAGFQHIFARFLTPANTFLTTTDLVVSVFTNNFQINPSVATLNNSNVVMVWASFNQAGSNTLQDVYAKILSPAGLTVSNEFLVNQFTNFNQRTPVVAALKNGGFVVAWVSEQERTALNLGGIDNVNGTSPDLIGRPSVDVYARLYNSSGAAAGNEFPVNTDSNPCANPSVAAGSDGGFMVAWAAHDLTNSQNSLDVYARLFSSAGTGGTTLRVNSHLYGDQYAPRLSSIGTDYLAVWTSLAQDGSREGVFGQFLNGSGGTVGGEFRVNTTTIGQQMQPAVASDGVGQFLAVWTSFTGFPNNFDLFAQRYLNVGLLLPPMAAPFVYVPFTLSNGVYQPQLQVSWPLLLGISVSNYEVYVNGSGTPMAVTKGNQWTMTAANGLGTSSTNSFQVDYITTGGARSPISPSASGATWSGLNWGGIPYEWMTQYFGSNTNLWPSATADPDGDGANNLQEFMAGTDPTNAASVLRVQLNNSPEGMFLSWPTQPGLTYQVQVKTNLAAAWVNLGTPRFAAGVSDSIYVGGSPAGYYRVVVLLQ
jgi:hypothetical protein